MVALEGVMETQWSCGKSFLRLGLGALHMLASNATSRLMAWLPIPLQELEPCITSLRARQKQAQAWFSKVEPPTRSRSTHRHTPQLAVA